MKVLKKQLIGIENMPTTINKVKKYSAKEISVLGEEIRELSIAMSALSQTGETGSSLSISDILAVLYFRILNLNPTKPEDPNRDRFILSKGHGAAAYYAALALRGFFPLKKLLQYRVNGGAFHAHPSRSVGPFVETSTGSLGHGLSIGVGMAWALTDTDNHVFVLVGDGECNEGSVWEAALFAGHHVLSNITVIIDVNGYQGFNATKDVSQFDLGAQWEAFGWHTLVADGHNSKDLINKLSQAKKHAKPTVVLANTIAGMGVPEIEHTLDAHYYVAPADTAENKINELKKL